MSPRALIFYDMSTTAASSERSRLVWTSSAPDYDTGDVVWAHRQGDFPGKFRPMLVVKRSGPRLTARAFTTERHRLSIFVEASVANGLHHESWLSMEDEEMAVGAVESKMGVLEPALLAKLVGAPWWLSCPIRPGRAGSCPGPWRRCPGGRR